MPRLLAFARLGSLTVSLLRFGLFNPPCAIACLGLLLTGTPLASGAARPQNAVAQIADNYRRLVAGQPLANVADKAAGY
jgi:hypothetical protein